MNEITEKQYAFIAPHMPVQRGNVQISNLRVINAILFVAKMAVNGVPCRRASEIGTLSTPGCGVGRMQVCWTAFLPRFKSIT